MWITRVITAQTEATDGEQPEKEIREKQRDYDSQASPSAGSSVLKKRAKLWSERETVCRYGCIAKCGRAVTPDTIQDRGRKNKGVPGNFLHPGHCPIDEMSGKDWQDVININLTGVFHSAKSVVTVMKRQKYGRIVLISSLGGRTGRPGVGVNYAASKAAVVGMMRLGELEDIAAAIAYLGSDDAAWTTGEILDVNGGL